MRAKYPSVCRNLLLVANYESDVGYAWWLMETFWVWLADMAEQQGRKTYLIYPKVTVLPESIAASKIHVSQLVFPTKEGDDPSELIDFVLRNQVGIIYLTDRPYASHTYGKLRETGVQSILNHDHTPGQPTLGSLVKWLPRRISILAGNHYCDHYIAVSDYVHRKHIVGAAIPRAMCHVVRNGIPLKEIPAACEREQYRTRFAIQPTDLVIVSVGRADIYKGVDFLISCAHEMQCDPRFANVKFLHCGSGPHLELFREQIQRLSLGHRFQCLGHRDDIHHVLSACDIAVHASPAEAGSLAILEYMAAGLPVVAPKGGANKEQIVSDVTGYFYRHRNAGSLKQAIARLIDDDERRQQMGSAGRERIEKHFSGKRMRVQFEQVLSPLINV